MVNAERKKVMKVKLGINPTNIINLKEIIRFSLIWIVLSEFKFENYQKCEFRDSFLIFYF